MAVYTHLGAEEMAALIATFDVGTLVSAKGIAEGVSNSNWLVETTGATGAGARFILTMYEFRIELDDLPYFLSLLDHLAERGCPVPRTIHDRDGKLYRLVDGKGLALIARSPGRYLRFALAPGLEDGMAVVYACSDGAAAAARSHAPDAALADAKPRPTPAALLELHTLQALDATLAGASLREVGEGLFGADAVADWYADGGLRSKVRRLARRGDALMRGGYRSLAQLPPVASQ